MIGRVLEWINGDSDELRRLREEREQAKREREQAVQAHEERLKPLKTDHWANALQGVAAAVSPKKDAE